MIFKWPIGKPDTIKSFIVTNNNQLKISYYNYVGDFVCRILILET